MDLLSRAAAAAALAAGMIAAGPAAVAAEPPAAHRPAAAYPASVLDQEAEVVLRALSLLGVGYRWGGDSAETGLDCSGLVRLVFQESLGLLLPRRSEEMSRAGSEIRPSELRPGDLVFFDTLRRAFSHVGIYIGNNQFVHAPAAGGVVRVERIDQSYWERRFNGARRVVMVAAAEPAAPPNGVAAAVAPARGASVSTASSPDGASARRQRGATGVMAVSRAAPLPVPPDGAMRADPWRNPDTIGGG